MKNQVLEERDQDDQTLERTEMDNTRDNPQGITRMKLGDEQKGISERSKLFMQGLLDLKKESLPPDKEVKKDQIRDHKRRKKNQTYEKMC